MRLDALPTFGKDGIVHVVVESPRGSGVKLKYEPHLGVMMLSRPLPAGITYPHDWGFVPGTRASDGDPIDALVLSDVATASGVLVPCRLLGVVDVEQNRKSAPGRERNDRVIAVPESARRLDPVTDVFTLAERVRAEIESFFVQVTVFEGKDVRILGWRGVSEALALVRGSRTDDPKGNQT